MEPPELIQKKSSASVSNPLKVIDILEGLAQCPRGAGCSDLAQITNLSKSSVYRLLTALSERQYVVKDEETKTYRLGFRLLYLSSAILDSIEIKHIARRELRRISEETGETVHLICLDGMEAVYIDKIDTPNAIGLKSQIGKRIPLYCTGGGKVLLAYQEKEYVRKYFEQTLLKQFTENTITDKGKLHEELQSIRKKGYALDDEEHHNNITCISVPVFNGRGDVVASISISAPTYRFPVKTALNYIGLLQECSQSIGQRLF